LSVIRQHMDDINYIESSSDPDVLPYYEHFWEFRSTVIRKQHQGVRQLKFDDFFKTTSSTEPVSPEPSTSKELTPIPPYDSCISDSENCDSFNYVNINIEYYVSFFNAFMYDFYSMEFKNFEVFFPSKMDLNKKN
jgi:hypothetical protein